ncbi:ABC transporter ATP-binding protein [Paenibacillus radicis (ex Xue et al. 2023)]|uniref:ABC transporter ATP-binding protein n=1 Tax=Paenibacillus radicis (ex Xue et al. 2023) TaxID=2972489 RepID=A0ABT1YKU1_9BACL|nr:ABC transporter ATP-binding protein [Paenibacillus radicis (ex Xue et al. 2023)]MCR8632878.1 ABC transporter ATP-binding protein [Paenibacillus radicis (ex Xue et al. 2023)]
MTNLLEIKGLRTEFLSGRQVIPAVDGVDITIKKGEVLGIVGESGCGKSVTSLTLMRLLPRKGARIAEGKILYKGNDLLQLSKNEMRQVRGNEIAMIFQEPMTSLNPVYTIGKQLCEIVMLHRNYTKKRATEHAIEMLRKVSIPRPEKIIDEYPHQLSGGMRQRVMIAMAMSCEPDLLIADEPTTALDVTIQAQILNLMKELCNQQGTSIMLITHDLGVVAEMCQRVVVMYAGQVVEQADVYTLFENPLHPYTQGLLKSVPKVDVDQDRLDSIPGTVPLPGTIKQGCRFASRCSFREARCLTDAPPLFELHEGQQCRCWLYEGSVVKEAT